MIKYNIFNKSISLQVITFYFAQAEAILQFLFLPSFKGTLQCLYKVYLFPQNITLLPSHTGVQDVKKTHIIYLTPECRACFILVNSPHLHTSPLSLSVRLSLLPCAQITIWESLISSKADTSVWALS